MVERPGLAKKVRGLSDSHWSTGMEILKKFMEKGGRTEEVLGFGDLRLTGSVSVFYQVSLIFIYILFRT